ncbi:MAG TPA: hypothetical protein VGE90_03675 [Chitinophaga sp.]
MDELSFLDKDYERKINFLTQQFSRMWTRFNYFVTIESSLIGGKFLFDPHNHSQGFAVLGIALSFVWYVFGANDKYLVEVYRTAVKEAGRKITSLMPLGGSYPEGSGYHYVGDVHPFPDIKPGLSCWRIEQFSITHLAAWFPFILTIAWIVYLITA